jgi:hypothetical protein
MAITVKDFDFSSELDSDDLDEVSTNIEDGIADFGINRWLVSGQAWCVIDAGILEASNVWLYDDSLDRFTNFTQPATQEDQTPFISPGQGTIAWAVDDFLYFASDTVFDTISFKFSGAGVATNPTYQYSIDGGWSSLTSFITGDGTTNWTVDGDVTFTVPSSWVQERLDATLKSGGFNQVTDNQLRFWIRAKIAQASSVKITQLTIDRSTALTQFFDLLVEPTDPESQAVCIRKGCALVDGEFVSNPSRTVRDIAIPDTSSSAVHWIASVIMRRNGDIDVIYGEKATSPTSPEEPNIPIDAICLAPRS